MGSLKDRINAKATEILKEDSPSEFRHSASYHRHFEGYQEKRVPNKSGRGTHIERKYVGVHYRCSISGVRRVLLKLGTAVAVLLSAMLMMFAMFQDTAANRHAVSAVLQAVCMISVVLVFRAEILYLMMSDNAEISAFRAGSLGLRRWCTVFAITMAILAVFGLIWNFSHGGMGVDEWQTFIAALTASALSAMLAAVETKIKYEEIEGEQI